MKLLVVIAVFGVIMMPLRASAHYPIVSQDRDAELILHVEPNHDPVAGITNKVIFFKDNDSDITAEEFSGSLTVTGEGYQETFPLEFTEDAVIVDAYFPKPVEYQMDLLVEHDSDEAKNATFSGVVTAVPNTTGGDMRRPLSIAAIAGGSSLIGVSLVRNYRQRP